MIEKSNFDFENLILNAILTIFKHRRSCIHSNLGQVFQTLGLIFLRSVLIFFKKGQVE